MFSKVRVVWNLSLLHFKEEESYSLVSVIEGRLLAKNGNRKQMMTNTTSANTSLNESNNPCGEGTEEDEFFEACENLAPLEKDYEELLPYCAMNCCPFSGAHSVLAVYFNDMIVF
ncbi:hypothetical protein VNO77_23209 [Canavalia gladiata]|uniref:Uncharacterized protein n=1 Tax=Canavalia gladiata TaxID=3824 RepID=A0AAN9L7F8_CANGL